MVHAFNYLLSESTFAFEVSQGRMRMGVAPDGEDGKYFRMPYILRTYMLAVYQKIHNRRNEKYVRYKYTRIIDAGEDSWQKRVTNRARASNLQDLLLR